jgi:phosphate starvation-inducible PhoH-like protein
MQKYFDDELIEIVPVSFMRGRTFLDSMIIVDEAQNVTHDQMEMIVSRLGIRSKMIICGDDRQIDLRKKSDSGFRFLYKASRKVKNLKAITLTTNHRDPIVDDILDYYEEELNHITSSNFSGSSRK